MVTMLFKLCLATYFQENLLMAQFASNPFQVVYLFSNKKKLQFTHMVSMYPLNYLVFSNFTI